MDQNFFFKKKLGVAEPLNSLVIVVEIIGLLQHEELNLNFIVK